MHILVVTQHARSGSGPGRNIVATLSALLLHSEAEVTLVAETMGDDIARADTPRFRWMSDFYPKQVAKWPTSLSTLRRAAKGTDVVWVPANLGSLVLAQSVRSGRPLLCGPNVSHLPHRRLDAPGKIETELLCDAWVVPSHARVEHVRRHADISRLIQIPHAISTVEFSPSHRDASFWKQHGLNGSGPIALFVGKDYPLKGLTPLLDALQLVNRDRKSPVQFAAVGSLSPQSEARIASLPWAIAPGFLSGAALSAAIASADFAVTPSSWENFSFSVLEAQSSGLPSICGSRGGMPEIVVNGETGLVVEIASDRDGLHIPEAPERLAAAIAQLADNPALRAQLGAAARQRVIREFSFPRLADNMMAAFHSLKSRSSS